MAINPEFQKKLQIFLAAAIVLASGRAAFVVYQRREAVRNDAKPRQQTLLNADYYVTPKKLHPYDLKSARQLTAQPVWVKYGYQSAYYPYDPQRHKTDFSHEAGTLLPLQKLAVQDVVTDVSPRAPGVRQVLAVFYLGSKSLGSEALAGRNYAVPIGAEKGSDFKIYCDEIFFIEDPHDLYKHWPADVWKKIDAHQVQAGMSELQASFAIGLGIQQGFGGYGSRTLHYANGGKPLAIAFENDKAVAITPGS